LGSAESGSAAGAAQRQEPVAAAIRRARRRTLNDLVSGGQQRFRHLDAEQLGGFRIDDQFEFSRCLHRQVSRLLAL
jgi:hypothetical protein